MSEPSLSLNFDFSPSALVVYNAEGKLLQANQRARAILGLPEHIDESAPAEDQWLISDEFGRPDTFRPHPAEAAIRSRQPQIGAVARIIRPDGAEAWIQVDAVPVINDEGSISHVVATLADVTRIFNAKHLAPPSYGEAAVIAVTEQLAAMPSDPGLILRRITSTLSNVRSGTWIAALMNKDLSTVTLVAAGDSDPRIAEYVQKLARARETVTTPSVIRLIETGNPVLMPSVPFDEFMSGLSAEIRDYIASNPPPLSGHIAYVGVLIVPMRAGGRIVGMLGIFERRGSRPLSDPDVKWVQEVADRTGLAVENARQYLDSIKRHERLAALRTIGLAVSGSPDARLTLQVVLNEAIEGLEADAGDVLRVDRADGMLVLAASTGFHSAPSEYRLPIDDKLPGRVLRGHVVETASTPAELNQFRRRSMFLREGFTAYCALPLTAHGKTLGVLEVFKRAQFEPDEEWFEFLTAIGSEAAIAINDSLMSESTRQGPNEADQRGRRSFDISPLERQILGCIVEGMSNRVIAQTVHRSEHTVKFHIGQLLDRFEVGNRTALARRVTQERWI